MIKILGNTVTSDTTAIESLSNKIQKKIVDILSSSSTVYEYDSMDQLKFELDLRKSIIDTSMELYKSKLAFTTFKNSMCNPNFWERTNEGGFLLKEGIKPSDAIRDIFINSSKYGTECATAIVIIYYKAILNLFPENLFNRMFSNIHLMDWIYLDSDLGIKYYSNGIDYLPGDCRYFKNPDVNPETPQWQGENAIDLGNGTYYGHGIGIKTAEEMINALNKRRKDGATVSAYLMDNAVRPDFKYLFNSLSYNRATGGLRITFHYHELAFGHSQPYA